MELLKVLEHSLDKSLKTDEYDEYSFASPEFTKNTTHILNNYAKHRPLPYHLQRLLQPHTWLNDFFKFKEVFGVKDLLDDIQNYISEGWLFLHYEISVLPNNEEGWKQIGTFPTLDVAFKTLKHVSPTHHHVTKVYFRVKEDDKLTFMNKKGKKALNENTTEDSSKDEEHISSFKGVRVFPSRTV